jgi:hypothetical protein
MSGSRSARNQASICNRTNICGGNKKAGFPYQVGRDSWASIAIPKTSLPFVMNTKFPLAKFSRPIGGDVRTVYFSGIGKH